MKNLITIICAAWVALAVTVHPAKAADEKRPKTKAVVQKQRAPRIAPNRTVHTQHLNKPVTNVRPNVVTPKRHEMVYTPEKKTPLVIVVKHDQSSVWLLPPSDSFCIA